MDDTTRRSVSWKERLAQDAEASFGRTEEGSRIKRLEERVNNLRGGNGIKVQDGVISVTDDQAGARSLEPNSAPFILRICVAGVAEDLSILGAMLV